MFRRSLSDKAGKAPHKSIHLDTKAHPFMLMQPKSVRRHGGLVEALERVREGLLPACHLHKDFRTNKASRTSEVGISIPSKHRHVGLMIS